MVSAPPTATPRLMSLDAFRGLVIVVMFLVNVAGMDPAFPAWFAHRGWADGHMGNGLADFVFPCFLFTALPTRPGSPVLGATQTRSRLQTTGAECS